LAGNNKVHENFDRKDRYGVFQDKIWDKVVDLYYDDPNYKAPEPVKKFHIEPYNERFDNVNDQIVNRSRLNDAYMHNKLEDLQFDEYEAPYTSEHLEYESKLGEANPQRKNLYSKVAEPKAQNLPGIANS
jgi:hypothetical protein